MKSCPGEKTYTWGAWEQVHRGRGGQGHFQDWKIIWTHEGGHDVCSEKKPEDDGKEGKIFIRKHTFIDKDDKILDFELA